MSEFSENGYYVNGLFLPPDLYVLIDKECNRRKALSGSWPGVFPVILDALYSHFGAVEASYKKEV